MALDALEGEQKLGYSESRREHLWRLLQTGMDSTGVPAPVASTVVDDQSQETNPDTVSPPLTNGRKRSSASKPKAAKREANQEPAPKRRQTGKKTKKTAQQAQETSSDAPSLVADAPSPSLPPEEPTPPKKKPSRRVGQRKPQRDPVG